MPVPVENNPKVCFVIAPIGSEGSVERKHSDDVFLYIITPVIMEHGYKAIRADHISRPGNITFQIIQYLVQSELVVADLTGQNPNVFYELAIRHAARKPTIHLIKEGERIPFDVVTYRTIKFDPTVMASVARCRDELSKQLQAIEEQSSAVDNPVSMALDLQGIYKSEEFLTSIQDAIRISLLSDDVVSKLVNAISQGNTGRTEERVAQVLDAVADQTAERVREANVLTIDSSPLVGFRSGLEEVWQVSYNRYRTVSALLNALWVTLSSTSADIPAFTYGERWVLRDASSGKIFNELGSSWAKESDVLFDNRSLKDVGTLPGMTLEAIPY
jgi:hypothetical protein